MTGVLIRDPDEAVREFGGEDVLALDLETSGLSPWKDTIAVVTLASKDGRMAVLHLRGRMNEALTRMLSRPDLTIVGHNVVGFDALFMETHGFNAVGPDSPTWYDTMLGELAIIQTDRRDVSVSLASATKRRLGKTTKSSIEHSWMVPELDEQQVGYCTGDILQLFSLKAAQYQRAVESDVLKSLETEQALAPTVMRMSLNGVPFDHSAYQDYVSYQEQVVSEMSAKLQDVFGPVNYGSPVQVKRALASIGINPRDTKADTLEDLIRVGGERVEPVRWLLELRHGKQRLNMYTQDWVDTYVHRGFVHARFWQCSADTGRMTSSNPNFQQIPKDMRWVFGGYEGHTVLSHDYSQIEVRAIASISKDQALLAAVGQGGLHAAIASDTFGVPIEEVTNDQRQLAKGMTFTFLFGGGWRRFYDNALLAGAELTEQRAQEITGQFFRKYSGVRGLRDKARTQADRGGATTLRLPTGLKRVLVGSKLTATRILNTLAQGTAAAGLKFALLEAQKEGLDKYFGAAVHDEIVSICPDNEKDDFSPAVERCMLVGMAQVLGDTPVAVGIKGGKWWGPRPEGWAHV